MNAGSIDWSDIPYILAVCETGSLAAAARSLNVNHSTVYRRISKLEERLGVRLFERLTRGYLMTEAGELLYSSARSLREEMRLIGRELRGRDDRLEGELVITTTNSLLYHLTPLLAAFQQSFESIEIKLVSTTRRFDLGQRAADIAIRPTNRPPEHWSGKKLIDLEFGLYAHKHYCSSDFEISDSKHRWVVPNQCLSQSPMSQMVRAYKPVDAPTTTINSVMGILVLFEQAKGLLLYLHIWAINALN